MDEENYILELSSNYITFDPLSSESSVFYDDNNRQIFMVKQRGVEGVTVKGPSLDFCNKFYMEDRGDIISIKFSTNFNILAVQQSAEAVNFINFQNGLPAGRPYSQSCKNKSKIVGIVWTSSNDIFFFTSTGLEFYHVNETKQECKLIKNFTINASWFVFEPTSSILLLATGSLSNIFQPFHFQESAMYKLNKFEVELNRTTTTTNKTSLNERDVTVVNVYGKTYLLVIIHNSNAEGSHIALYNILKDSPLRLSHILQLYLTGKFAVSIVDDVIVVHHQTSQTSLLFDINLPEMKRKGAVAYHGPIVPPYTIKPFRIKDGVQCELYSTNWFITNPNIIIDPKLGCLWVLQINLLPMCRMLSNESQLFDFLIFRRNSKNVLVNLCNRTILQPTFDVNDNTLATLSFLFKKLNRIYKEQLKDESKPRKENEKKYVLIDQKDMFQFVFASFEFVNPNISDSLVVAVLFDYIDSLIAYEIPIQYFIYKLLINLLIRNENYYQLHQFLQYHVFTDSKQLACQLLSLHQAYPPALQLALDMFKRLNVDQEYILEIFLSKLDILRALRFLATNQILDSVSARKYLEYSLKSNDLILFYSVFKCFQERNQKLRGSYQFAKDEQCEEYVKLFEDNFGPISTDSVVL